MTSPRLVQLLYIAILTVSVGRALSESSISSISSLSSAANPKHTENEGATESDNRITVDEDSNTSVADNKRKWGENTMMAWGKRSSVPSSVEELTSLLLRNPPCAAGMTPSIGASSRDRRRWGEKSMSAWGKRRNSLGCEEDVANAEAVLGKVAKRKWGEKTMQVWGKRLFPAAASNDDEDVNEERSDQNVDSPPKRKWGENSMSAWGKREHGTDEMTTGDDKRKWGSNSMLVWGKREQLQRDDEPEADDWSHAEVRRGTDFDAEVNGVDDDAGKFQHAGQKMTASRSNEYVGGSSGGSVQGARSRGWHRRHGGAYWGPKRKWETNTMKVWGKRNSGASDLRGLRIVDAE